jgi:hypothetical protein
VTPNVKMKKMHATDGSKQRILRLRLHRNANPKNALQLEKEHGLKRKKKQRGGGKK